MRDIAELDPLARELKVCFDKAGNYRDTAKQRFATVKAALEHGEYGEEWTPDAWLLARAGLGLKEVRLLYSPPRDRARLAIAASPGKSDRAIAAEIGVSHPTVAAARRATGNDLPVEARIGLDGRARRVPEARDPKPVVAPDPVDRIMALVAALSLPDFERFKQAFRAYCGDHR